MFKDDSHGDYERILSGSLSRTVDFVKFAEAKNAALLTFASAWALAITSILATNRQLANAEIGALALSRVLFVLTVLVAALSFLPKLRPESFHRNPDKPKNLLFYGDIALFEFETFKTRLPAAYLIDGNLLAGERYLDDLTAQIWINSKIARRKFTVFNFGAIFAFVGIVVAMIPAAIGAIHWLGAHLPSALV
jgi:hypothetical protein